MAKLVARQPPISDRQPLLAEKLGFLNASDFGPDGYLYGPLYGHDKFIRSHRGVDG